MTSYHGGKHRLGKKIALEMLNCVNGQPFTSYCEPFCGMLGVYRHVLPLLPPEVQCFAGDTNASLVEMWTADHLNVQLPISAQEFCRLKRSVGPSAEKGFIGFAQTYRGVFFDGYFNHPLSRLQKSLQRVEEIREKIRQHEVKMVTGSYLQFSHLQNSLIYCDPPYRWSEQRYYDGHGFGQDHRVIFDHEQFDDWLRKMMRTNIIFLSEYNPPDIPHTVVMSHGKENLYLLHDHDFVHDQ